MACLSTGRPFFINVKGGNGHFGLCETQLLKCERMLKENLRSIYATRVISVVFVILSIFLFSVYRAECAAGNDIWIVQGEDSGDAPYDLTEYKHKIGEIYNMFVTISCPCAAVAFAIGALMLLTGDEKTMAKGKRQMIFCLAALAAIIFLPVAVNAGMSLGYTYGWTPPA